MHKKKEKESIVYPDKYYKALETLSDSKLEEYISDYTMDSEVFSTKICIHETPDQYVMARYERRSRRFYNPKENVEKQYRRAALNVISKEDYNKIQEIINSGKMYNVDVTLKFYIPIPKNLNIKQFVLSEKGIRKPIARRDCDNMSKLFFDAMANIFYPDDCYITGFRVDKYSSIDPRIEAEFTYTMFNEKNKKSELQKEK